MSGESRYGTGIVNTNDLRDDGERRASRRVPAPRPTGRVYGHLARSRIQTGISIRVEALNWLTLSWIASISASSVRMIPRTSGLRITALYAELDAVVAGLRPLLGVQAAEHVDHALELAELEDVLVDRQVGPLDGRLDHDQAILELAVSIVLGPYIHRCLAVIIALAGQDAVVGLDVRPRLGQAPGQSVLDREPPWTGSGFRCSA